MARGAIFFDVDGTLVPRTSSSQYLARLLGHSLVLTDAEASYAAGRVDNHQVSVLDASGWRGHRTDDVDRWLQDLPLVAGIADVLAWCRARSLAPYLATLAWRPVGEYLCRQFQFDGSCGPGLETAQGEFTGEVASHFDEFDKRDFAMETASHLGLRLRQCIAVGDSRSDLPLFAEVGLSVAFNGDRAAAGAADIAVQSDNLTSILPALDTWLGMG